MTWLVRPEAPVSARDCVVQGVREKTFRWLSAASFARQRLGIEESHVLFPVAEHRRKYGPCRPYSWTDTIRWIDTKFSRQEHDEDDARPILPAICDSLEDCRGVSPPARIR